MRLRLGLIGAGYWGAQLIRTLAARHDTELCSVTDRDGERLCTLDATIARVSSVEAMCSQTHLDAVMIATPPSTHFSLARQVLQAGKHCWIEKPMAVRADEAQELVALASTRRCTLFVDETFLYDPLVQRARAWIRAGRLGRVFHYSFERLSMGRIRRDSDIWWNAAPHDLALLRYLAPSPVSAIRVQRFAHLQPNIADVCVGSATLEDGASVHLYISWLSPVKAGRTVAVGDKGMLVYDGRFSARSLTFYAYRTESPTAASANVIPIEQFDAIETISGGDEEPLGLAVDAFVRSILTGEPSPSDGAYSAKTVELLAQASYE